MFTIPTDSADARELREVEAEREAADAAQRAQDAVRDAQARRAHAERCHAGWLGEDAQGRPVPCPACHPVPPRVVCCPDCAARESRTQGVVVR